MTFYFLLYYFFISLFLFTGEQNGYNIPEVKECSFLPEMLEDENKLFQKIQSKSDKEIGDLKRLLCDGYICMYRSEDLHMYN